MESSYYIKYTIGVLKCYFHQESVTPPNVRRKMLEELAPFPSLFIRNAAAQTYPKWPTTHGRFYSHEEEYVTKENAGVFLGLGQA